MNNEDEADGAHHPGPLLLTQHMGTDRGWRLPLGIGWTQQPCQVPLCAPGEGPVSDSTATWAPCPLNAFPLLPEESCAWAPFVPSPVWWMREGTALQLVSSVGSRSTSGPGVATTSPVEMGAPCPGVWRRDELRPTAGAFPEAEAEELLRTAVAPWLLVLWVLAVATSSHL